MTDQFWISQCMDTALTIVKECIFSNFSNNEIIGSNVQGGAIYANGRTTTIANCHAFQWKRSQW